MPSTNHPTAVPQLAPRHPADLAQLVGGELLVPQDADASPDAALADVTIDSRQAGPGVLFACRPGARADGHDYAPAAVAAGSPALLVQRRLDIDVPQILVDSVADRLGAVAAAVHGDPSRELTIAGVTGTNGKTTCAMLLEAVLSAAGHRVGLIGTIATRMLGTEVPGVRTTPEATDLQRLYRRMRTVGVDTVAMEVSSHGLALGRVNGTRFAVAMFTNLTHDHLDFHGSMRSYFAAKARLFTAAFAPAAVIDVDDPWGAELAASVKIPVTTVSCGQVPDADVVATAIEPAAAGSRVRVRSGGRSRDLHVGTPGIFNVANALVVLAAAQVLGVDADVASEALAQPPVVPGRMEQIDEGQPFIALVDYAHTPDSLCRVLDSARAVVDGRVIVVIGCGGDRDRDKRPEMGAVAARHADHAVFTNDNPRSEDPAAILGAIVTGARSVARGQWTVEPDRRAAIATALRQAAPGDAVVVAGKGHETGQQLDYGTVAFDDREVTRGLLRDLAAGEQT